MGKSLGAVVALLLGSGFSALVYQTAWQRLFRLTFGASTAASAAVLAIFLGGLGLGGALLGRRVERSTRPLLFYGNLELGVSALAAVSPLLCEATHSLYLWLGGSQALGTFGATALRLLLAALVIGPAAVLMGGTLPAAARAVVTEADVSRRSLALLYSLNTVGAVLGALVGPLALFGVLGTKATLWAAVCVNALVGITARAWGRQGPPLEARGESKVEGAESRPAPTQAETRLAYVAAGLVGFVFLGLELVWFRVLTPLLGGTSLTFGLILACALAGIGVGGYLFSRRAPGAPVSLRLVALTLSLEALGALVPFAWGDGLAFVAVYLRSMASLGFGELFGGWVFVAGVVVLPASIVSGYQFPALLALLGRGRAGVGVQVGRAYAFNTVGTLFGSLLVGFWLLPAIGAITLWRALALALALLGLACAAYACVKGRALWSALPAVACSLLALLLGTSQGPTNFFRHSPIGAGRQLARPTGPNEPKKWRHERAHNLLWARDGVETSVAISGSAGLSFLVNGKTDGAVVQDRGTQAFLGLLPAALHGNAKHAFVVGLGTGMTSGLLARVPGIVRVDVAELEPSVLEMARRARLANGAVLENPKVSVLLGDGRELLLTGRQSYDVIISEPSNPYRAGVAALFTHEYYAAAASRLNRGGLFAQWFQGYEVDARAVAQTLSTLRSVFPHVTIWGPEGNDMILMASFEPQVIDVSRLRTELEHEAYARWMLRAWSMEGPEGLVAHSLANASTVEKLIAGLPMDINTDDVNSLELAVSGTLGDRRYSVTADLHATLGPLDYRPVVRGELDWARVEELRHRSIWEGYRGEAPPSARARAVTQGCGGSMKRAKEAWPADAAPLDAVEVWVRAYVGALDGADDVPPLAARLEAEGFLAESLLVRERWLHARGDTAGAVALLVQAVDDLRKTALPLCDAGARALKRASALATRHPEHAAVLLRALARGPLAVHLEDEQRLKTMLHIGGTKPPLCLEAIGGQSVSPFWESGPLALYASCLSAARSPAAPQAQEAFAEYLASEPVTFTTRTGSEPAEATAD
ncbi:MAG: Spermidine synthase [Polyangiaceae bacterium]|jgi:spermidine synthase|nr:Spermidine synthase [Polyangiaceae bacterium]